MKFTNKHYLLVFALIVIFVFRSLISNINTDLLDWRDYSYYAWLINQNSQKIVSLNFTTLFDTNAFYPNKNTLFFSDTLLTQSIIAIIPKLVSNNPIAIFNWTLLITILLDLYSAYLFWKLLFKDKNLGFLGSLFSVFSPFFYLQLGHLQMLTFWPFYLCLYYFIKSTKNKKKIYLILTGLLLTVQFLASVYLSIFLAFIISLFVLADIFYKHRPKKMLLKYLSLMTIFLATSAIFIKGYLDTQKMYDIQRPYGDYVNYSAHISDYVFTSFSNTIVSSLSPVIKWNSFNLHKRGAFPGFLLTTLAIVGLLKIKISKRVSFEINLDKISVVFFVALVSGVILSFGPRANFNGHYAEIPLPYDLLMKTVPIFEIVRAPSRWVFIFFFGVTYFSLKYLKLKKKSWMLGLVLGLLIVEYIPLKIDSVNHKYLSTSHMKLRTLCKKNDVLLEVPVTHFDGKGGIIKGLTYITDIELASLYHGCNIANGYSGYDPLYLQEIRAEINTVVHNKDLVEFQNLLSQYKINYIVFNLDLLEDQFVSEYEEFVPLLDSSNHFKQISDNTYEVLPD